jgi:hypothetical protein
MASQGVSEEISTHHPLAVVDNLILNGLTIDANEGSNSFHLFDSFWLCSGEFMVGKVLKKSPVLG